MDIIFSPEENLLRESVRDFAEREIKDQSIDQLTYVPLQVIRQMGKLGYLSLNVSEEHGGNKGSWVMIGSIVEEIARYSTGIAHMVINLYEIIWTLDLYGTNDIKKEWLPKLINGEKIGCMAYTEADKAQTIISKDDRDGYLVQGKKDIVSFANQSDFVLLFGLLEKESRYVNACLILPLSSSGIKISPINTLGLFPSNPCSIYLERVYVPSTCIMGTDMESIVLTHTGPSSPIHRVMVALACVGVAQEALKLAINYSKGRKVFGKPICSFGAISGKIAEDHAWLELAKSFCYKTLALQDAARQNQKEATICAMICPKIAYKIIQDALLIHGHYGYSKELRLQQMLRDVIALELIAGSEGGLKTKIAAELIGREAMLNDLS